MKERCADNIALLLFVRHHYAGRLFRPVGKAPSRKMVIAAYTEMFNMFGGDWAMITPRWCVRFDYYPDISLLEDAYRLGFFLAKVERRMDRKGRVELYAGDPICPVNSMKMIDEGFAVYADDITLIAKVDHEGVQRAVQRRKEEAEANPSRHHRPLPQPERPRLRPLPRYGRICLPRMARVL